MAVMTPDAPPVEQRVAPNTRAPRRRRRRPLTERLTLNVVVGVVAALLAFVLAASLLADRREMVTVTIATEQIPSGATITADMIRASEVPADIGFARALVTFDAVSDGSSVATRTIQAGEPLTSSSIGAPGSVNGQRVMSIPLEPWQAANGELKVGDTVDVIEATREGSRYVLTNASVVGRSSDAGSGGLVGGVRSADLVILVEVDGPEALDLAAAIEAGTIMVVRSTGADPLPESSKAEVEPEVGE